MKDHNATVIPQLTSLKPKPAIPAIDTAKQLQERLLASYGINTQIRTNKGVAIVVLECALHVWVFASHILWDTGQINPITRGKICAQLPPTETERAARLIAVRYQELRSGRG